MMTFIRLMLLSAAPAFASMARQVNNSTDPRFPIQNVSSASTERIGETVGPDPEVVTLTHFVTQAPDSSTSTISQLTNTLVVTVTDGDPSAGPWDGSFETPIQPDWTSTAFEIQFVTVTQEKEITTLLQTVTVSPSTRSSQIKTFGPIKPVPETIPARPPKPTTATTSEWESPDWTHHEASPAPWIEGLKKERITVEWCKDHNDKSTCDARDTVAGICYDLESLSYGLAKNIATVGVINGQCLLFSKHDCRGKHTGVFRGRDLITDKLCTKKWSQQALSIRCCTGDPFDKYCGQKKQPKCKE